jgi:hypothetical protein
LMETKCDHSAKISQYLGKGKASFG